jgi:hypothetical protein
MGAYLQLELLQEGGYLNAIIWTNEKAGKLVETNGSLPVGSALQLELLHEGKYLNAIIWTNENLRKYLEINGSLPDNPPSSLNFSMGMNI